MEKKRFLFDVHNFDDVAPLEPSEPEEYIPPIPTYSEEELQEHVETAREDSFQRGKQEGFRESEEGFTQKIHALCQTLSHNIETLIEAEEERLSTFRQNTYDLVMQTLTTALPDLMRKGNFDSCLALISEALETYVHEGILTITVQPDYIEPLQTYFEQNIADKNEKIKFVEAPQKKKGEALSPTHLSWEHGGAVRDPDGLKKNIIKLLEQSLAQKPLSPHNGTDKKAEKNAEKKNGRKPKKRTKK